jgi:hypothetical protein
MRWLAFSLILKASLCLAAPRCPDPNLRQAKIGGDSITGYVMVHEKPLKFAQVRVSSSSLFTFPWLGMTDQDGRFVTGKLPPADYRLEIDGWGSTNVELDPRLDKRENGQVPNWGLFLTDNACVATGFSMN